VSSVHRNAVSSVHRNVVVGIFERSEQAHLAVNELRFAGFRDTDLGVITRFKQTLPHSPDNPIPLVDDEKVETVQDATAAAAVGAGIGSVGALALATLSIPGFGPIYVGGFFAMLALGMVGGAMAGGLVGSLIGMGVPEHRAHEFEQAMLAGRTVVNVHTVERQAEAAEILNRNGAHHIDTGMPSAADA
jgi:hypothetical protein